MDPFGIMFKYLTASGQVSTTPIAVKAVYTMHSSGTAGSVKFYNISGTPGVGDVSVGQIDLTHQGSETFTVPEHGALFDKGCYLEIPADTTINVFYKDARYA